MIRLNIIAFFLLYFISNTFSQVRFENYFTDHNMRIDYYHSGNASSENVVIDHIYKHESWAGSFVNLIDHLNYGAYYHKVYDAHSKQLIYSRGFDSFFKEYQTSKVAISGAIKTFHESAIIPYPKQEIIFTLEKRNKNGALEEIFQTTINPSDISIIKNEKKDPTIKVFTSLKSGDIHTKADIAIIGEGYTAAEEEKFKNDLKKFTTVFFQQEPCKSHKNQFNITGVFKPSAQSGVDEPRSEIYKKTALSASFNSLGSERYLLTEDNKSLRDIASHTNYDALYIMVNHSRYGGGGIYNFYCTFTTDNEFSEYLMVHEFGHSFFGLADEYYTSSTAYTDFYSSNFEPSEPNITALKDSANVKWKHLLSPGVKVPTYWEKEAYDQKDYEWQKKREEMNNKIASLQQSQASNVEIKTAKEAYNQASKKRSVEVQQYLENCENYGKIGAFEGAGYMSKGLYRSSVNCIMFTKTNYFCKVCEHAMVKMIDWYSK